jgi:hypothetical protein
VHRLAGHPELGQIAHRAAVDAPIGLAQLGGFVFGKPHVFQHIAPGADELSKVSRTMSLAPA